MYKRKMTRAFPTKKKVFCLRSQFTVVMFIIPERKIYSTELQMNEYYYGRV